MSSDTEPSKRALLDRMEQSSGRRSVLRSVAASAAGVVGLAGVSERVAADPIAASRWTPSRIDAAFETTDAVRAAVESAGVLDAVAAADIVSDSATEAVDLTATDREVVDFRADLSPGGARTVEQLAGSTLLTGTVVDGRLTPQIYVFSETDDGVLVVSVLPEYDDGFAALYTGDDLEWLATSDVTVQSGCEYPCEFCPEDVTCDGCTNCAAKL